MTSTLTSFTKKAMEFWRQRFGPIESNTRRTAEATERIDDTRGRGADGIRIEGDPDGEPVPVTLADSGDNSVTSDQLPLEMGPSGGLQVEGVADGIPVSVIGEVDQGAPGRRPWLVDGSAVTQPVSITGTITATGAAEHVESTTWSGADTGVLGHGVRNDSDASLGAGNGEFISFSANEQGHAKVQIYGDSSVSPGTPQKVVLDASGRLGVSGTISTTAGHLVGSSIGPDIGNALMGVRNDTNTDLSGGDLTYTWAPNVDSAGRIKLAAGDLNVGNVDVVSIPAPLSTTGGGTEATALRVTLASDSTGVVSVDDNGKPLAVESPQLPLAIGPSGGLSVEGTPDGLPVAVDGAVDVRSLPAVQASYATGKLAAASVTSSFVLLVAFTQPARIIVIHNGTDQRVVVSFDGTTTHGYVPSFGSIDLPLGGAGRSESRGIWIKHDGIVCAMEAVTATVVT